jgi:APA family basic amino acid/polyamine antiporter
MGALPSSVVASSPRPIALMAERTAGAAGALAIGLAAIAAGTGTLNGWILMAGRIPLSAAEDGLCFRRLASIHPRWRTPHVALGLGTAVSSALLLLYFSKSLLGVFNFIVLLAVLTTLLPHLTVSAAELLLARRDSARYSPRARRRAHIVAPIAFLFVLYTIYGVGAETAFWGLLVVLAGTPLYVFFATARPRARAPSDRAP